MLVQEKRESFARKLVGSSWDDTIRLSYIDEVLSGSHHVRPYDRSDERVKACALKDNEEAVPTVCFSCHSTCEALVIRDKTTKKPIRVEGDPESPITNGFLCSKGLASLDLLTNPGRVGYPLKRVGERGDGKFQRISWDEALDTIADKLKSYKEKYGAQSIAMLEGTRRGWSRVYSRFANVFGTPNNGAAGWAQCLWPRLIDCNLTYGRGAQYSETHDFPNTSCVVCWGVNPATSWGVRAADIMKARQRGALLLVVDPYLSESAAKADVWLQIKPDTDMALALGLMNVIIDEGLYDKEFVERYTFGFDQLVKQVKPCTAQWASEKTGVDAEKIKLFARLYAKSEASSFIRSLGVDQLHDSVQVCRAISLLIIITGNIGKPGSNNVCSSRGETSQNTLDFIKASMLPKEIEELRPGYREFPLLTQEQSAVPTSHMPSLWRQVISKKPYPIRCATIFGSNAVVSYTNSTEVEQALKSLEFLAVCDIFMTPTAKYADIVLPASTWLERKNMISSYQTSNTYTIFQQPAVKVDDEARSDVDIVIDLAKRLGLGEYFWEDSEDLYDHLLSPAGLSYKQGLEKRRLYAPMKYGVYKNRPFKTPSGKIEIYSILAEEKGCDPLPSFTEPFSEQSDQYPLLMTTGRHENAFRISENRQNPYLLELSPKAWLDINPSTAKSLGIQEGDRILVTGPGGQAYAYARFSLGLHPQVVQAISGWWGQYNINRTIGWDKYAPGVGSVVARGYWCRVEKAQEEMKN
jgi:anaerobic selenocysteine-containing dehydrogenase